MLSQFIIFTDITDLLLKFAWDNLAVAHILKTILFLDYSCRFTFRDKLIGACIKSSLHFPLIGYVFNNEGETHCVVETNRLVKLLAALHTERIKAIPSNNAFTRQIFVKARFTSREK